MWGTTPTSFAFDVGTNTHTHTHTHTHSHLLANLPRHFDKAPLVVTYTFSGTAVHVFFLSTADVCLPASNDVEGARGVCSRRHEGLVATLTALPMVSPSRGWVPAPAAVVDRRVEPNLRLCFFPKRKRFWQFGFGTFSSFFIKSDSLW